jgi:hypothetical protein
MLDASAIEGSWIAEEAPDQWIKRVKFNPLLQNSCRISIKNVGPKIIRECKKSGTSTGIDFFEETKNGCKVQAVIPSLERCAIVINGTQAAVGKAKEMIEKRVWCVMEHFRQRDEAQNATTGLRVGSGLVAKGNAEGRGPTPFHTIFSAYGNDDCSLGANVASFAVDCRSFPIMKERVVFQAHCHEAHMSGAFWRTFRSGISSGRREAVMTFVRSHAAFIVGPSEEWLATALKNRVIRLGNTLEYYQVHFPILFDRFQVRRFVSILAELRNRCPAVLFHVLDVTLFAEDETASSPGFLSDYEWLMTFVCKVHALESIRLCFSALTSKDMAHARDLLKGKLLSDNALLHVAKRCERKQCVMCRRTVTVLLGKYIKVRIDDLEGWNLSLCGCSFCRECFRHGVTETLKDAVCRSARCLCCKRIILAKDCSSIIAGSKLRGPRNNGINFVVLRNETTVVEKRTKV